MLKSYLSKRHPFIKAVLILFLDLTYLATGNKRLILIYSKGKSGTTTLAESLKRNGVKRVYQFHNLDKAIIQERIQKFKKANSRIPSSLINGIFLRIALKYYKGYNEISIITLVRDPIDSLVSSYFQNRQNFYKNSCKPEDIIQYLKESDISLDKWFSRELIAFFDINPFEKFNVRKGYQILIVDSNTKLLLLKTAKINSSENLISKFLRVEDFKIEKMNEASTRSDYQLYKEVKENLRMDKLKIENLMKEKSMIFFSKPEIQKLKSYVKK